MGTERNHAIDLLKFLAAVLITNSHMETLYPGAFRSLATGGAIGDALFFFCSGYLLMRGKGDDFFNWYKRRINRIIPTVFSVALIGIIVFGTDPTLKNVIIHGGGWFVQAILVFYAVFWFVKRFLSDKLWIAYVIDGLLIMAWFIFFWDKDLFILTNATYLRWPCYFMIMLSGASAYRLEKNNKGIDMRNRLVIPFCLLLVLLLFYYGYQLVEGRLPFLKQVQIVLFPALMGIVWILYSICSNHSVQKVYRSKCVYWPVYYISACCLEIYLSQGWCFDFGRQLISFFPLNVIATFILVFVVAYLVKVFSNFLSQTFKTEKYDWKGMVKL